MNFVLLDDIAEHNQTLARMLESLCRELDFPCTIALQATRASEVIAYAHSDPPRTIYMLDIRMKEEREGLELFQLIQRKDMRDLVVFVTGHPQYALDCLKLHAFDMLVKPVVPEDLRSCLRAMKQELVHLGSTELLQIPIGSRFISLSVQEVVYFSVHGRYVMASTLRGEFRWRSTLHELEEQLNHIAEGCFVRIHRNYIINRRCATEWNDAGDAVLVGGMYLPVSRRIRRQLIEREAFL